MRTLQCRRLLLLCTVIVGSGVPFGYAARPYVEKQRPHGIHPFCRPAKQNPAAQLAYAEELQRKGRIAAAMRQYRALTLRWPDSPETARALLAHARLLEKTGHPEAAFDEYEDLLENHAGTIPYEDILERQLAIARRLMETRKGRIFFGGFEAPERAIPLFEKILNHGPQWARAPEVQYLIGLAYEKSRQYELAVDAYAAVMLHFPESPFAEKASFSRCRCLYRLARGAPNDDDMADAAWAALTLFLDTYPQSQYAAAARSYRKTLYRRRARAAYNIALFYDRIARRPAAALIAYRRFVRQFLDSGWTPLAKSRIQELEKSVEKPHENQNLSG